jgi:hypothetical protein
MAFAIVAGRLPRRKRVGESLRLFTIGAEPAPEVEPDLELELEVANVTDAPVDEP